MNAPGQDDILIAPRITDGGQATAPVRGREDRHVDRAARDPRGVIQKLRRMASMRNARRVAMVMGRKAATSTVSAVVENTLLAGRVGASGLGAVLNPIGLIVTALVVGGVVALRLGSGRPFEGMAEDLNKMFLGDLDDEARAKMATRQQLEGDQNLMRIVGQQGKINSQVRKVADQLYKQNLLQELGAAEIRRKNPVNGTIDILILRAAQFLKEAWKENGGPDEFRRLQQAYQMFRLVTKCMPGCR